MKASFRLFFFCGIALLPGSILFGDDWVVRTLEGVVPKKHRAESSLSRPLSPRLAADQFGSPLREGVSFVLRAKSGFAPRAERVELRRVRDDALVETLETLVFRDGAIDELSGDRGSRGTTKPLAEAGEFVLVLPDEGTRSHPFSVEENPFAGPLTAALRSFYFQRANFEKSAPYACDAGKCWTLPATHEGPLQDGDAHPVPERDTGDPSRDLRGGHWDAGDTNKYVTFAAAAFDELLTAFERNPGAFGDDLHIPESNNGLPDVLDETLVSLRFLEKMQADDLEGGVLPKVGAKEPEPFPSEARNPRFYIPGACPSATIATSVVFAHGARLLAQFPKEHETATRFVERAQKALVAYDRLPKNDDCERGELTGGDTDRSLEEQRSLRTIARIHLWLATKRSEYLPAEDEILALAPFRDLRWSVYHGEQGSALVSLARDPSCPESLRTRIVARYLECLHAGNTLGFDDGDLYEASVDRKTIHWGSSQTRARHGLASLDGTLLASLDPSGELRRRTPELRKRALGLLHSFHGKNPLGLVYLSNMESYGAERSVTQLFHTWFRDGHPDFDSTTTSRLGPAPGYVVGGPSLEYCAKERFAGHLCLRTSIRKLPPLRRYIDENTGYDPLSPHDSLWELSENGIYYQAAYVALASAFVHSGGSTSP